MIGRQRDDGAEAPIDEVSLWASDTIPVNDGPSEFDWSTSRADDPGQAEPQASGRLKTLIGAGVATGLLLLIAALVWPRGDDPVGDTAGEIDAAPTTLETLPASDTTVPPDDDEQLDEAPDVTEPDIEEQPATDDDVVATEVADSDQTGGGIAERPTSIAIPPAVAAITTPTEIVMVTSSGVSTLSLPSGNVRYTDLSQDVQGGQAVAGPDATAITDSFNDLVIVPRVGPPIPVDLGAAVENQGYYVRGWSLDDDGASVFDVTTFDQTGEDSNLIVTTNGEVRTNDAQSSPGSAFRGEFLRTNGQRLVNDAGGVYEIATDGTSTRILDGVAFAAHGDHVLVRECDEARSCELLLRDLATGGARSIDSDSVDLQNQFSLDVAPTGDAVAAVSSTENSSRQVIVDVDLGVVAETLAGGFVGTGTSWAPDGSGYFMRNQTGRGLQFLDRATGAPVRFGEELVGIIQTFSVRYPDAELPADTEQATAVTFGLSGETLTAATNLDLVVLGDDGQMTYLDVDELTAETWTVPNISSNRPPEMFVNGDSVTVIGSGQSDGFNATFRASALIESPNGASPFPPSPRYPGPSPELVWSRDSGALTDVGHRLFVIDGSLPASDGPELEIENAALIGGDGRAGLLVDIGGDVFAVDQTSSTRIAGGDVLALNRDSVMVRECDEQLTCEVAVVQRDTGTRTPSIEPVIVSAAPITADRAAPYVDSISPDGSVMLISLPESRLLGRWAIVDLVTGSFVSIREPTERQPLVWSDDSSFLAYVADGDLHIYDRAAATVATVERVGNIRAMAGVSPSFAADLDEA